MATTRLRLLAAAVLAAVATAAAAQPPKKDTPPPKRDDPPTPTEVWAGVVEKGRAYLKTRPADDGSFGKGVNPGITAIVVLGLAKTGDPADPAVRKALGYIEGLVDDADGSICKGANTHLTNYLTSINVQALATADPKKYDAVVKRAARFLVALQYDETKGKPPADVFHGGVGYNATLRPDLSNTSMTLQAVAAAGVPRDDPFFHKALVYVGRCQNLKGETNDQPWGGKIDDGSFLYGCGPAAERMHNIFTPDRVKPDDPHAGYGSMTAAGLISLDLCGVGRDDRRFRKALQFLADEFTVECNPGMAETVGGGTGGWCYYYYLAHLAKAFDRLGVGEVTDRKGRKHDWRAEVTRALQQRQRKDGSWANESDHFYEGDPNMATGWALIALAHSRPSGR